MPFCVTKKERKSRPACHDKLARSWPSGQLLEGQSSKIKVDDQEKREPKHLSKAIECQMSTNHDRKNGNKLEKAMY